MLQWYLWMLQKILTVEENFKCCMQPDMYVAVGISILKSDARIIFTHVTFMLQTVISNVATITF
jgi:hypothetical protein